MPELSRSSPLNFNALQSHCVSATLLLAAVTQRTTVDFRTRAQGLYREFSLLMESTAERGGGTRE